MTLTCSLAGKVDSVSAAAIKLFDSFYTKARELPELLFYVEGIVVQII